MVFLYLLFSGFVFLMPPGARSLSSLGQALKIWTNGLWVINPAIKHNP
jgi:hypothetical protein